jgi:hypothetical protein
MPFLDVPERPFCNDNLPRCFICEASPALCLYNTIAEDNYDHGNPHTQDRNPGAFHVTGIDLIDRVTL